MLKVEMLPKLLMAAKGSAFGDDNQSKLGFVCCNCSMERETCFAISVAVLSYVGSW
jgi:hypothetical protein